VKKRTTLNYETVKHMFEQNPDEEQESSYFRVLGGVEPQTIAVPISIMHRLFRLGQAYNIRQLRYLEPNVKMVIGTVDIPNLVSDLNRLKQLVNDEVLHHYVDTLLDSINSGPGPTMKHIAVATNELHRYRS
jgi:hypothetical protein